MKRMKMLIPLSWCLVETKKNFIILHFLEIIMKKFGFRVLSKTGKTVISRRKFSTIEMDPLPTLGCKEI